MKTRKFWAQRQCSAREQKRLAKTSRSSTKNDTQVVASIIANAAEEKKANATLVLDVRSITVLADYFVITGGQSPAQVRAISDAIEDKLSEEGIKAKSIEGKTEGRWVLMDYDDVIVHILQEKERDYYKLEQFWNHALIINRNEWSKEG
ncbi:MAG: ribosome silencing factor [Candidatus Obscuribacterales bacterium]|nr:ribosome silencing factor [Candidatus Obscuribacterales bacterium]